MTKITAKLFKKDGKIIIAPATKTDAEELIKLADGTAMQITIGQPRRPDRNRAWWAAIGFFIENCNEADEWNGKTKEWIHSAVQIEIGHTDILKIDGETFYAIPKGTAFEKIADENEYNRLFFEPAMKYLAHRIGYDTIAELMTAIAEHEAL
jgi:hypothetical protein